MTKTLVITIHGQESVGKNMRALTDKLGAEVFMDGVKFINLRYTKLPTIINTIPWVRTMTAKYIAARLDAICAKHKGWRIIVIAHSNGTRATRIAMDMRYHLKKKWPLFWIDDLILLGCPIKRNYEWNQHPETNVLNFVSVNDKVVWLARFYGMGAAGRFSFTNDADNLKQIKVKWGHNGFMKQYPIIADAMQAIMDKASKSQPYHLRTEILRNPLDKKEVEYVLQGVAMTFNEKWLIKHFTCRIDRRKYFNDSEYKQAILKDVKARINWEYRKEGLL